MALSRIWSAFFIIAILMAGYKCIFVDGQNDIFNRMVTGKADEVNNYVLIGDIKSIDDSSKTNFAKFIKPALNLNRKNATVSAWIYRQHAAALFHRGH